MVVILISYSFKKVKPWFITFKSKTEDSGCIKEKCLECKKFITVMDMKTHLEVCKEAKRLLEEEKEKEYVHDILHCQEYIR